MARRVRAPVSPEVTATTLLRSFEAQAVVASTAVHRWKWVDGTVLFPEARCPLCAAAIRSTRIWQVGERRLVGLWKFTGRGKQRKLARVGLGRNGRGRTIHPHVGGGGDICAGNSDSGTTALFLGMNVGGAYWSVGEYMPWLRSEWNHHCKGSTRFSIAPCSCAVCKREAEGG